MAVLSRIPIMMLGPPSWPAARAETDSMKDFGECICNEISQEGIAKA